MLHGGAGGNTSRITDLSRDLRGERRVGGRECTRVQAVERREGERATVRRRTGTADLRDDERGIVHGIFKLGERTHRLVHLRRERHRRHGAGGHVHTPDLSVVTGDQRLRVGGERRRRIEIAIVTAASLRVVALHIHHQPPLGSGAQIAQLERAACIMARGVHQPLAVGTRHRTKGALHLVGADQRASGTTLELRHLMLPYPSRIAARCELFGLLAGRCGVVGVQRTRQHDRHIVAHVHPQIARIARQRGSEMRRHRTGGRRRALRPQTRQLHARATTRVVHPQLAHAGGDDVLPIGRPDGRRVIDPLTARDQSRLRAVGVRDPHVLRPVPVAHEHELFTVGREARLLIPTGSTGDAHGGPTGNRQRVEVAENVERDRVAVGRHVERDPRRFVGAEAERAGGGQR